MSHNSIVTSETLSSLGGGGTSYSRVYGEAPPEKGDFLSLQHSERLEKSLS